MQPRIRHSLLIVYALALITLISMTVVFSGMASPIAYAQGPTEQQQTINAIVNQRFTQTAQVEQQLGATQTIIAAFGQAQTATADFQNTIDAQFNQALTATAGFQNTVDAQFNSILTQTAAPGFTATVAIQNTLNAVSTATAAPGLTATIAFQNTLNADLTATAAPGLTATATSAPKSVYGASLSADKRVLALFWASNYVAKLDVWDLVNHHKLTSIESVVCYAGLLQSSSCFALSSNGAYLAYIISPNNKTTLIIKDLRSGAILHQEPLPGLYAVLTFSPDAQYLAYKTDEIGSPVNILSVSTWQTSQQLRWEQEGSGGPYKLSYSPDGHKLAYGRDGTDLIIVWDVATATIHQLSIHSGASANTLGWSPDSKILASPANNAYRIFLWDTNTWQYVQPNSTDSFYDLFGRLSIVNLEFSAQGDYIATGKYTAQGPDVYTNIWDISRGNAHYLYKGYFPSFLSQDKFMTISLDGTVYIYNLKNYDNLGARSGNPPEQSFSLASDNVNWPAQPTTTTIPQVSGLGSTCPAFAPSRLATGMKARVLRSNYDTDTSKPIRSAPSGPGIIGQMPFGAIIEILDGPSCSLYQGQGIAWWKIQYQEIVGWTSEGLGDVYYLEPVTGNRANITTTDKVLKVGAKAQVHVLDEGLKLRSAPSIGLNVIENLPDGTIVTIRGGPTTEPDNLYTWWYVISPNGNEGWVVEAADGIATLIPIGN